MSHRLTVAVAGLVALVVFFSVPLAWRGSPERRVVGPTLAQLDHEEVAFTNGDLALAGLLFMPDGDGPFPAAVFIHGSGTSRRDNPWYLSVAGALRANGIAVLLPDKRGSEKSGGDWRDTSFEVLATDTEAALRFLTGVPAIDPDRIGLVGFSQGGWIAPVVAANNSGVTFVASLSGAGVTTEEQLLFEEINNIEQMGTYRFVARLAAPIAVRNVQRRDTWRATAGYDPMPWWSEVGAPIFAAFGEGDTNVPVEESARRLEALPGDVIVRVYPNGRHGITDPASGQVQPALLNDLVAFVRSEVVTSSAE